MPRGSRTPIIGAMRPSLRLALGVCLTAFTLVPIVAQESRPSVATRPESFPAAPDKGWDVRTFYAPSKDVNFTTTEGTWIDVDVSPDGRTLAFDLLGDVYTLPIEGGKATCIRSGPAFDCQPRYAPDGKSIVYTSDQGGGDNVWVMDPDGANARQITKESYRLLNSPCVSPDGRFVAARKHFTSQRSLGAGEVWLYALSGGDGVPLTTKRNDQMDAGEPEFSPDGRFLYYSEDTSPGASFEYNKDPNAGIYAINRVDLKTGEKIVAVGGPGGAIRPKISPDGKSIAYVHRSRAKTVLMLHDIASGADTTVFEGLSKDQQETWAIFGVHPHFAWMPDGASLVVSAQGHLWRIDARTGAARMIPFEADVKQTIAATVRVRPEFGGDTFRVHEVRWPSVSEKGILCQALGGIRYLPNGATNPTPVAVRTGGGFSFMPAWSPDASSFAFVSWDDQEAGALWVTGAPAADGTTGPPRKLTSEPGHYANPSWSSDGRWIVFEKLGGDAYRGRRWSNKPGIYRVPADGSAPAEFVTDRGSRPRFHDKDRRLLLQDREGEGAALVSTSLEGQDRHTLATSARATEFALSPDERMLAFTELWQTYVCRLPATGRAVGVSPGMGNLPCVKVSRDAGEFLSWSKDGTKLYHHLGSTLSETDVTALFPDRKPESPPTQQVWERNRTIELGFDGKADVPSSTVAFVHARIITLEGDQVIEDGTVVIRGNRIEAVGPSASTAAPAGSQVIDAKGKTIAPGFVDIHSHMWASSGGLMPQSYWPYLANLAFGVTTTHDPSNDTKFVFAMSELQKAGTVLGPRIFSTGTILYGAEGNFKAVVDSLEDARSHLRRVKAHGAWSVKSYNQPRREQRQQILQAARELQMNVVPEGGSTLPYNLTHVMDGHTTVEHALPVAPLREDVLRLFAASGTGYTPTLIVGYGGIWGENYWYQKTNVWENEHLLTFVPRSVVDSRSRRRTMAPDDEFNHFELAKSAAELHRRGVSAAIGSHGQLQGLGAHWEIMMFGQGGLPPLECLRVASMGGARSLGIDQLVGSLKSGKLADLAVFDKNPLDDIANIGSISGVMVNGRLYDARTLDSIAPAAGKRRPGPALTTLGDGISDSTSCCGDQDVVR